MTKKTFAPQLWGECLINCIVNVGLKKPKSSIIP